MGNLLERLIGTAQALERLGLSTVGPAKGSCSVRDVEAGFVYLTPSGKPFRELDPSMLVKVDLEGNRFSEGKPSVDFIFHRAIYVARPEIKCIIHLHSPYATAFAVCRREIPIHMQAIANTVGYPIPIADFALPGTEQLGKNIVRAMEGKINAVLMANHGIVACGATPEEALHVADTVETGAQVSFIATLMGGPIPLTQEEVDGARGFYASAFLGGEKK